MNWIAALCSILWGRVLPVQGRFKDKNIRLNRLSNLDATITWKRVIDDRKAAGKDFGASQRLRRPRGALYEVAVRDRAGPGDLQVQQDIDRRVLHGVFHWDSCDMATLGMLPIVEDMVKFCKCFSNRIMDVLRTNSQQ